MNENLTKLIDQVANNRRMPREKVIEMFKEIVLLSWARNNRELRLRPLKVEVNERDGEVEIYSPKQVVEEVKNGTSQIEFQEAIKINPNAKLGDDLLIRVQPDLVESVLPGAAKELFTGIREEYPREGKSGGIKSLPHIPAIPDCLPKIPDPETPVSPSIETLKGRTAMEEPERDTTDLISILTNEPGNTKTDQGDPGSSSASSDELEPNCEKVLLEIESALAKHDNLQVRRKLNELQVEVTLSNRSFTTVFHVYNQMITAKSLLPYIKEAAVDLLELSGLTDFTSSIGKASLRGKDFYVIKNSYPLKGVSRKVLWEMVCQPILEASKAIEIIESYLNNGDFQG